MPVQPSLELENTIKVINSCFQVPPTKYWLGFGAAWSLIMNGGVIPDHDLDIQTYYEGQDWQRIRKQFESRGYTMTRAMVNDVEPDKVVYMAFSHPKFLHICLTFVYLAHGIRWYCHDNHFTIPAGTVGKPTIGYFFKGYPDYVLHFPGMPDDNPFIKAEWPGISQTTKISVLRCPGAMMDFLYPAWAFHRQRYNIDAKHTVIPEKMVSIHKGGAISPYMVHLQSMGDFANESKYRSALAEGQRNFKIHLKTVRT